MSILASGLCIRFKVCLNAGRHIGWRRMVMKWRIGDFAVELVIRDWFKLDAGFLFRGAGKRYWPSFFKGTDIAVDENNMVRIPVNAYLITAPDGRTVLVDTGLGDVRTRWSESTLHEFEPENEFNLLPERGIVPDYVIPTHLHWDHAGGLARVLGGRILPVFQKTEHIFHKNEYEHARAAHPYNRSSYRRETIEGIKAVMKNRKIRVNFAHSKKWKLSEVGGPAGIELIRTRGHTPGHMSVLVGKPRSKTKGFITGALLPTRCHCHLAIGVGNDTHGLLGSDLRLKYLLKAANEKWIVFPEHDVSPAGRISIDGKGAFRFDLVPDAN